MPCYLLFASTRARRKVPSSDDVWPLVKPLVSDDVPAGEHLFLAFWTSQLWKRF